MSLRFFALFLLFLPGCTETTRVRRRGVDLQLEKVQVLVSWKVKSQGGIVGRVLKVRLPGALDKEPFYLVQWPNGGPVGRIDGKGRAYRYEPFKKGLVLIGMDSLEEDVKALLELTQLPKLEREPQGEARPASGKKTSQPSSGGNTTDGSKPDGSKKEESRNG